MFSKRELLLFIYGWIRTLKRSSLIFLKYFWWLLALEIFIRTQHLFIGALSLFTLFFAILSTRATLEAQDSSYFISHLKTFLGFALLYAGAMAALIASWMLFTHLHVTLYLLVQAIVGLFLLFATELSIEHQAPFPGLTLIKNALAGMLFYLPFIAPLITLYIVLASSLGYFTSLIHPWVTIVTLLCVHFFFLCGASVLYVKMRYKNRAIFFGQ